MPVCAGIGSAQLCIPYHPSSFPSNYLVPTWDSKKRQKHTNCTVACNLEFSRISRVSVQGGGYKSLAKCASHRVVLGRGLVPVLSAGRWR